MEGALSERGVTAGFAAGKGFLDIALHRRERAKVAPAAYPCEKAGRRRGDGPTEGMKEDGRIAVPLDEAPQVFELDAAGRDQVP